MLSNLSLHFHPRDEFDISIPSNCRWQHEPKTSTSQLLNNWCEYVWAIFFFFVITLLRDSLRIAGDVQMWLGRWLASHSPHQRQQWEWGLTTTTDCCCGSVSIFIHQVHNIVTMMLLLLLKRTRVIEGGGDQSGGAPAHRHIIQSFRFRRSG